MYVQVNDVAQFLEEFTECTKLNFLSLSPLYGESDAQHVFPNAIELIKASLIDCHVLRRSSHKHAAYNFTCSSMSTNERR